MKRYAQTGSAICPVLLSLLLILGIATVFWPVSGYKFLNFDDNVYVTDNVNVCRGFTWESVRWAFTTTEAGFWHPLTWLSLMGDCALYRLNPGGYHWTNVLFHIASTLLLFFLLRRMTGSLYRSGLVAALFAVPPLQFEKSIDHFERALQLQPDYANAHYYLALVFIRQGLSGEARRHYQRAVQINPAYGSGQMQADFFKR